MITDPTPINKIYEVDRVSSPMSLKRCVSVSMVELALGGSATNRAIPSSLIKLLVSCSKLSSMHQGRASSAVSVSETKDFAEVYIGLCMNNISTSAFPYIFLKNNKKLKCKEKKMTMKLFL